MSVYLYTGKIDPKRCAAETRSDDYYNGQCAHPVKFHEPLSTDKKAPVYGWCGKHRPSRVRAVEAKKNKEINESIDRKLRYNELKSVMREAENNLIKETIKLVAKCPPRVQLAVRRLEAARKAYYNG